MMSTINIRIEDAPLAGWASAHQRRSGRGKMAATSRIVHFHNKIERLNYYVIQRLPQSRYRLSPVRFAISGGPKSRQPLLLLPF